MRKRSIMTLLLALSLVIAACGDGDAGEDSTETTAGGGDTETTAAAAGTDLLAAVQEVGSLKVSTDPAYPPQSSLNSEDNTYEGFDIDVATEIAERLGVEVAWETPAWDIITAGGWNGRWEMSVGSMTPTNDRQQVLNFTQPYYYTPAVVVVHADNTSVADIGTDLDGTTIGVCSGCTYEQFLQKTLAIEGFEFDFVIDDAEITGYDTDTTALQDLALGDGARLTAVITSLTTAQGYIDAGNPVKIAGEPVFYEPLAVAFDKSSQADGTSLFEAVEAIVAEMHADGTLSELSKKWYNGIDLTVQQ
ncbi:MAG: transporter substrate-binding domain-containing protein [Acidimicrobiia bacterium]